MLWPYRRSALEEPAALDVRRRLPAAPQRGASRRPLARSGRSAWSRAATPRVDVRVRFLHVVARAHARPDGEPVDELGRRRAAPVAWDEATEREARRRPATRRDPRPATRRRAAAGGGAASSARWRALARHGHGRDRAAARRALAASPSRSRTRRRGTAATASEALRAARSARRTPSSAPSAARSSRSPTRPTTSRRGGRVRQRRASGRCSSAPRATAARCSPSPIILSDYPQIAPESPGDLFDGGEIDQLLILNMLSLTDGREGRRCAATDPRAREILERCRGARRRERAAARCTARSATPAERGVTRLLDRAGERRGPDSASVGGTRDPPREPRPPAPARRRRRLRPRARRPASPSSSAIEEDDEGATARGGRRSTTTRAATSARRASRPPLLLRARGGRAARTTRRAAATAPRVLVAGIGNIFLGDDGFGVEVARRLARRASCRRASTSATSGSAAWTSRTRSRSGYDAVVFVDAAPRGEQPGHAVGHRAGARRRRTSRSRRTAWIPCACSRSRVRWAACPERALVVACEPARVVRRRARRGAGRRAERAGRRRRRRGGRAGRALVRTCVERSR